MPNIAKEKQHVFSARMTEEGLKRLNELKAKLVIGENDLVMDAVCAYYGLDGGALALPKAEPAEGPKAKQKGGKDKNDKCRITGNHTEGTI